MANIKDKALYFVGNKLLKYVYKNPQKNMLKLVKLGKAVAGKMYPESTFTKPIEIISDETNVWHKYLFNGLNDIDPDFFRSAVLTFAIDLGSRLDCVIMQMVRLVRDGETIKLSKRSGKAITLNTLIDEVPLDAARFFFNLREPNSHFDFDLELAAKQSSENPVYYVQYAHARICSIIKKAQEQGVQLRTPNDDELALLNSKEEKDLIRHLSALTDEIVASAKAYDPAKITHYVIELATLFHKFYNAQRVMLDDNEPLMQARLYLCSAVKNTIYNILTMLKITTPEVM